jgi:type I restriction enzyme R subunit
MMGLIDSAREASGDGRRRFGVGHFDLVVIDEAHRSVFQKYRAIFDYFDALLVGLTATPKDEVDRNTYSLFDLEKGVPTDAYDLDDAVKDRFLVPARAVSVPVKFQREGITYDDLSEEEQEQWDAAEWDDQGSPPPPRVEAEAINKWLFNKDTADKVLAHLMTRGLTVAGGDRLGKTIIFAANQAHAKFIEERFNANYPHWKGAFARTITFETEYAQSLIDDFTSKDRAPHIAISVDMLDTGIDVPEIVNLVFFKVVRSKTKFWQMVGRGTRLCPELFGPGEDKTTFYLFDYCQNLEFFRQALPPAAGAASDSLGKRLFVRRLELVGELDHRGDARRAGGASKAETRITDAARGPFGDPQDEQGVRDSAASALQQEVAAMNLDNFVVRTKRRLVEKYAEAKAWTDLSDDARQELSHEIAGLPSELPSEAEESKRFDLLLLNLQLTFLRAEPAFVRLRDQVKAIAGLLEEKSAIPMVRDQLTLIAELQGDEWWQDVTLPMLEHARRRLRALVTLIEKRVRKPIFTDFEDQLGPEVDVALPIFTVSGDFEKFRAKARVFLRAHEDHVAVRKLRMNRPLTASDLAELERMLAASGIGDATDIEHAKEGAEGLGLFVRSLVGLDREAAKGALAGFLTGKALAANQVEFVNLIVEHLTDHGVMPASALYESPFTDVAPQGPEGIFTSDEVNGLVAALDAVRATAVGGQ